MWTNSVTLHVLLALVIGALVAQALQGGPDDDEWQSELDKRGFRNWGFNDKRGFRNWGFNKRGYRNWGFNRRGFRNWGFNKRPEEGDLELEGLTDEQAKRVATADEVWQEAHYPHAVDKRDVDGLNSEFLRRMNSARNPDNNLHQ